MFGQLVVTSKALRGINFFTALIIRLAQYFCAQFTLVVTAKTVYFTQGSVMIATKSIAEQQIKQRNFFVIDKNPDFFFIKLVLSRVKIKFILIKRYTIFKK